MHGFEPQGVLVTHNQPVVLIRRQFELDEWRAQCSSTRVASRLEDFLLLDFLFRIRVDKLVLLK